jgi:hypothetical protein
MEPQGSVKGSSILNCDLSLESCVTEIIHSLQVALAYEFRKIVVR